MVSSADPKGEYITASVKRKNKNDGSHTSVSLEDTPSTLTNRGVSSQSLVEQDKATTSAPPLIFVKSDDIQLSIRMPSGNRLEIKVTKQDVLRKVKNFVDENKGNELSSYDLSLVYPKRVFSEQGTNHYFWKKSFVLTSLRISSSLLWQLGLKGVRWGSSGLCATVPAELQYSRVLFTPDVVAAARPVREGDGRPGALPMAEQEGRVFLLILA